MRTTGETQMDTCEFRTWLRYAMDIAIIYEVGSVYRYTDYPVPHIGNHAEFDLFLDALPVDIANSLNQSDKLVHNAMMNLKAKQNTKSEMVRRVAAKLNMPVTDLPMSKP